MKINSAVCYNIYIAIFVSLLNPASTSYAKSVLSADRPNCLFPVHYIPDLSEHIGNTDGLIPKPQAIIPYDNVLKNPGDFKTFELGFQLNGKLLVFDTQNISWYFHYTQQSYWQCYTPSAFFRATDYKPGFFAEIPFNLNKAYISKLNIRLGMVHQSNGLGAPNERTWNRIYGSCKMNIYHSTDLMIKLWHIINDNGTKLHNKDIGDYLGYGKIELTHNLSYRHQMQCTFHLLGKGDLLIQYFVPVTPVFQFVVQGFLGYGNNIMFYNEWTRSLSLGIAVSDLL